jgi:hypothetical protein
MPAINVFGVPGTVSESTFETIIHGLQAAAVTVTDLHLSEEQVAVFFPADRIQSGLGENVIAIVEGLYEREERTPAVLQKFARAIGEELRRHFPEAVVECFVHTINLTAGVWSSADGIN